MAYGEALKEALNKANMTQMFLAKQIPVTPQAVSKWVNNQSRPDIDTMLKVDKILEISITEVYLKDSRIKKNNEMEKITKSEPISHYELSDLGDFEKIKVEANNILKEKDIEKKYGSTVCELLFWFLEAVIGLTYHQYLQPVDETAEYVEHIEYNDIFFNCGEYLETDIKFKNSLERDFYQLGADFFESFGEDKMPDHDFVREILELWYRFKNATKEWDVSSIRVSFNTALTELINE